MQLHYFAIVLFALRFAATSPITEKSEWKKIGGADKAQIIKTTIAFHQNGLEHAGTVLDHISDPSSANFGPYLGRFHVEDLFARAQEALANVLEWLNNATQLRKAPGALDFWAPGNELEALLQASHHIMERRDTAEH